jgi:hypothetical protein
MSRRGEIKREIFMLQEKAQQKFHYKYKISKLEKVGAQQIRREDPGSRKKHRRLNQGKGKGSLVKKLLENHGQLLLIKISWIDVGHGLQRLRGPGPA